MAKVYCRNDACFYNDNKKSCSHHNDEYCENECQLRIREDGSSILRDGDEI